MEETLDQGFLYGEVAQIGSITKIRKFLLHHTECLYSMSERLKASIQ